MKNLNSQTKGILSLLILISILVINSTNAKNIKYCKDLDRKSVLIVQNPKPIRNLQSFSNIHGLRIQFIEPPAMANVDATPIKNMFAISAAFFKQLLKVTDVADSTKYVSLDDCGPTITPSSVYATSGFSFSSTDIVISTLLENDANATYIAYASACIVRTWPQYGFIGFNLAYFSASPSPTAQWQSNLLTLIHQVTHILALSPDFYNIYKKTYASAQYIPQCEAVTTYNSRKFITTPNVKAWAQRHYGCDQSSIGVPLEQQGGQGSVGSHWERATTLDDYMNAIDFSGNQVTPITLNLFKDTGFYYDVDFSLAFNIQFGKNKGCSFARGLLSQATPEFCTSNTSSLGFSPLIGYYGFYGGFCLPYPDSSNQPIVIAYIDLICYDSSLQPAGTTKNVYSSSSRAFYASVPEQYNGFYCFDAKCLDSNTVQIKVGATTGTCVRGGPSTIVIAGNTVYCPDYFDNFCSRQTCADHCSAQGYCSQGSCVSNTLCSSISADCTRCKGTTCTGCRYPLFPTGNSSPACDICTNINSLCTNGCQVTQNGITICKQTVSIPPIIGACPTCIAVLWCNTCTLDINGTNCLTCNNDNSGNPRYPTTDEQTCKTCGQFITSCTTCSVSSGVATCTACNSGFVPINMGRQCGCTISQCAICNNAGSSNQKCSSCKNDISTNQLQYPSYQGVSCRTCSQFITNCKTCTVTFGRAKCTVCISPLIPKDSGVICGLKVCSIADCATCTNSNTKNQICTQCVNDPNTNEPQYPNGSSCKKCGQLIAGCTNCKLSSGVVTCLS